MWFLSGLLALQSALISVNEQNHSTYQTAALLQERPNIQPSEPAGRPQSGTLNAATRAILTPVLYFSSKVLPFGSDGAFIAAAFLTLLAVFTVASFRLAPRSDALQAFKTAIRARAPPFSSLA